MSENLIAILINASIALIAVATLIYQRIYNRRLMDYNFHPIFKLYRFCNRENTHWTPDSCDGSNPISKHTCTKDHWFDVVNESTGIAFNVKVSLITGMEIASKLKLDDYNKRVQRTQALLKDGMLQYALPNDAIPFSCYQSKTSDIYFVIIGNYSAKIKFVKDLDLKNDCRILWLLSRKTRLYYDYLTAWRLRIG